MARRFFVSATLAALSVGVVGSSIGVGTASAAPARPASATVVQAQAPAAATGSKLPVKVPAKFHGVAGTLRGTAGKFTHASGHAVAHFAFTSFKSRSGKVTKLPQVVHASAPVLRASHSASAAAAPAATSCRVLNLVLGPLHLNLLGLVVNLNRVHLNITAVPGSGNLLGNLLCAVANLLNGSAPAAKKASLLNDVVGALGILGRL